MKNILLMLVALLALLYVAWFAWFITGFLISGLVWWIAVLSIIPALLVYAVALIYLFKNIKAKIPAVMSRIFPFLLVSLAIVAIVVSGLFFTNSFIRGFQTKVALKVDSLELEEWLLSQFTSSQEKQLLVDELPDSLRQLHPKQAMVTAQDRSKILICSWGSGFFHFGICFQEGDADFEYLKSGWAEFPINQKLSVWHSE